MTRGARDLIGGAVLTLIGLFFVLKAFDYGIGSVTAMQAGFFPMAVGGITVVIGMAILIQGWRGAGDVPDISWQDIAWRPLLAVVASVAAFAFLIQVAGFVPAIIAAVALAALADEDSRPLGTLLLAIAICLGIWLIFSVGLRLPIRAFGG